VRLGLLAALAVACGSMVDGEWFMVIGTQPASAATINPQPSTLNQRETHRIRIGNRKGAAVEVSLDGGRNWTTLGRVTKPATDSGAGFAALAIAAPGTVAAISREGIALRTDRPGGAGSTVKPRIFSLAPVGGAVGDSAIATDLPRGRDLFGPLAPPLGSAVLLESAGRSRPLPGGYIPQAGDHLVIVASVPADAPAMLVIENREGGRVLAVSPTGDESVVGHVRRPLRGVARYPATDGARCGGVASHHPASIVVATTPPEANSGPVPDTRQPIADTRPPGASATAEAPGFGGFLIQAEASAAAVKPEEGSVLVVDRLTASGAPLGLPLRLSPAGSLVGETRVEARLDGGAWEPLPAIGGSAPAALTAAGLMEEFKAHGTARSLTDGITHLRLVLGPFTPERLRAALPITTTVREAGMAATPAAPTLQKARQAANPTKKPAAAQGRRATKTLRVVANIQGQGIVYVMFYVDGRLRKMTNTPPYEWRWDTRADTNGAHSLEIRGADVNGRILTTQTQKVAVVN
jgi:hypothetical protein